jgi:cytochrome c553
MMKTNTMKKARLKALSLLLMTLGTGTGTAMAGGVTGQLLQEYTAAGAQTFSVSAGETAWRTEHMDAKSGKARSCTSCHTRNLKQTGKHVRTGKTIKPMAPSANPERLTDRKHVEKWFKRNCKWVLGRECTPQEKGDYLSYLQSL